MTEIWVRYSVPGPVGSMPTLQRCENILDAIELARSVAPSDILSVPDGQDPEKSGKIASHFGGE